jgi:hypothetical protein
MQAIAETDIAVAEQFTGVVVPRPADNYCIRDAPSVAVVGGLDRRRRSRLGSDEGRFGRVLEVLTRSTDRG